MKPAGSIILFTTLAGAAQGAAVTIAVAVLAGSAPAHLVPLILNVASVMLVAGLVASFFHLGHPMRAWRTVLMWRTSWMSREVIVLPTFIVLVAAWGWWGASTKFTGVFAALTIAGAFLLWYCTAMIYACIRFVREWAHPLTIVNYMTLGLASGTVSCAVIAALSGERAFAAALAPWVFAALVLAWVTRALSLRRNSRLKPVSTLQSATGIRATQLVQKSMGMTGGSFNTREFFHRAPLGVYRSARPAFQVLAFAVPLLMAGAALASGSMLPWVVAAVSQGAGLLIERWFFFAQAQHPQNLYYQVVS